MRMCKNDVGSWGRFENRFAPYSIILMPMCFFPLKNWLKSTQNYYFDTLFRQKNGVPQFVSLKSPKDQESWVNSLYIHSMRPLVHISPWFCQLRITNKQNTLLAIFRKRKVVFLNWRKSGDKNKKWKQTLWGFSCQSEKLFYCVETNEQRTNLKVLLIGSKQWAPIVHHVNQTEHCSVVQVLVVHLLRHFVDRGNDHLTNWNDTVHLHLHKTQCSCLTALRILHFLRFFSLLPK